MSNIKSARKTPKLRDKLLDLLAKEDTPTSILAERSGHPICSVREALLAMEKMGKVARIGFYVPSYLDRGQRQKQIIWTKLEAAPPKQPPQLDEGNP